MTGPANGTLEIDHLVKRYGQVVALSDMTFTVGRGELFGFVGSNGAGKTTTMRIVMGVLVRGQWCGPLAGQAAHLETPPPHRLHAGGARPLPEDASG